jgi:hypothetical protein
VCIAYAYADAWNTNTDAYAYNTDAYTYGYTDTTPSHAPAAAYPVSSPDSVTVVGMR